MTDYPQDKHERLDYLINDLLFIKQKDFADMLGINTSYVSNAKASPKEGQRSRWLGKDILKRLGEHVFMLNGQPMHVSIKWLETGQGEALIHSTKAARGDMEEFPLRTDTRVYEQRIPVYNVEASAGLVSLFGSSSQNIIDYLTIPHLPKCDGAIYLTGDSMYPLLKAGDIVAYKEVKNIKDGIFWGEMYLVQVQVDDDFMTVAKYLQRSDLGPDYVKLVSYNEHHAPKDIHVRDIRALALIKASVRLHTMS